MKWTVNRSATIGALFSRIKKRTISFAEAVGLAFHGFDLVVGAFQRAGRDRVVVPGEDAEGVESEAFWRIGGAYECRSTRRRRSSPSGAPGPLPGRPVPRFR